LFPEGGGQPCDTGFIDQVAVVNVQRHKLAHVHYTASPIAQGRVDLKVDWSRRWDHMQQHSGQHLLSAVLEQPPYNMFTIGWNLGEKRSYIELPTSTNRSLDITPALLNDVETIVNALIIKNMRMITHSKDHNDDVEERPDSLPADYVPGVGAKIRTVEIEALDMNPCCGTHMQSLGQLQCFKVLHTEKVRGGNTRVFFLFGQRLLDTLDASYAITRQMTSLLSGPQEQFVELVQKLQQQSSKHMKRAKRLLEALAVYTVDDVAKSLETKPFAVVYKEDADMEFLTMVSNVMRDRQLIKEGSNKVVVLAAGEKKVGGPLIVTGGNNDIVQQIGKLVMKQLTGVKGGGKGRWQGKAQNWDSIEGLEKVLEEELSKE
jgi:Ser-tRNA(Ala) deacylase AlaX